MKRLIDDIVFRTEFIRPYENICFVDTPGFNQGSGSGLDKDTAIAAISGAQALLWCYDVSGGTIHDDDWPILNDILDVNPDIRTYIIANRADSNPDDENCEILYQAEMMLRVNSDAYEGISLYSSAEKFSSPEQEKYKDAARGKKLADFLEENNRPDTRKEDELLSLVRGVFDDYVRADDALAQDTMKKIRALSSIE